MATVPAPSPARQARPPVRPPCKRRQPRPRPARRCRRSAAPAGSEYRILDITEGERLTCYFVLPLASDFGRCYRLEKVTCHRRGDEPDSYDVCLDEDGNHTCECGGWLRWGSRGLCRHIAALLALEAEGRLPGQEPELFENAGYRPGHFGGLPF
jgi:SWIM zinc finger